MAEATRGAIENSQLATESVDSSEQAEEKPFDHTTLPLDQKFMRHLTRAILFAFDYDPFAIYKRTHRQHTRSKYRAYLVDELRLEPNKWDRLRHWLRKSSIVWCAWLLVKYSYLCILQLMIYNLLLAHSASAGSGSDDIATIWINETTINENSPPEESRMLKEETARDERQQTLELVMKLKLAGELVGNVLSDYPGIALVMYLMSVSFACSAAYFLPHYYHRKPMDSIALRLGMDPRREIRRVDLLIEHLMNDHLIALAEHKSRRQQRAARLMRTFSQVRRSSTLVDVRLNYPYANAYKHQRRQSTEDARFLENLKLRLDRRRMRPFTYTRHYYTSAWVMARYMVVIIVPSTLAFYVHIQSMIVRSTIRSRCATKHIDKHSCSALSAYSLMDWWALSELVSQMYVAGFIVTLEIVIIFMSSFHQTVLADKTRQLLESLLRKLRRCDGEHRASEPPEGMPPPLPNEELLSAFVKLTIQSRDLRSESFFITELVASTLGTMGSVLVVTLLTGQMKVVDMYGLRAAIMNGVWIVGNIMIIRCAQLYARIVRFNRLIWPIMVMLRARPDHSVAGRSSSSSQLCLSSGQSSDYLATIWRKLILSGTLTNENNAVRPVGVCLTFKKVLEINFFIASLVALLRTH